ncbi:putative variable tail fiber protein [Pasteurella multocida subsp. multocida OH4807]|nr:putative variable tail fiber protein [Pasteurella multocida subsp. multocida OH4807]
MYALDNDSGVQTMPEVKSKQFNHNEPRWFTEGGNGVAPSYPGADWFNIVQAELLGVLKAGGINPDKANLNQLTLAIQQVVQNKVNTAISGKANTQHNHAMSDISGLSNALGAKAPLISPALTGTPTAPTANQSTNNTQIATTAFVKAAIAALVGSAPAALDTLQELANALGQDANFRNTIINQIAGKANASHTHTYSQISDFEQGVLAYINQGFTQSFNENGWCKLPNGLILQWGKVSSGGSSEGREYQVNMPISAKILSVVAMPIVSSVSIEFDWWLQITRYEKGRFYYMKQCSYTGTDKSGGFFWHSICLPE